MCAHNIPLYIFVFAVYLLVSYMCAQIRVWSCLVIDNFGLVTETAVCKFLRGWRSYGPKPFLFCPLYVFIHFSAAFCTAHCALDLARDHAPQKRPLLLSLLLYFCCVFRALINSLVCQFSTSALGLVLFPISIL